MVVRTLCLPIMDCIPFPFRMVQQKPKKSIFFEWESIIDSSQYRYLSLQCSVFLIVETHQSSHIGFSMHGCPGRFRISVFTSGFSTMFAKYIYEILEIILFEILASRIDTFDFDCFYVNKKFNENIYQIKCTDWTIWMRFEKKQLHCYFGCWIKNQINFRMCVIRILYRLILEQRLLTFCYMNRHMWYTIPTDINKSSCSPDHSVNTPTSYTHCTSIYKMWKKLSTNSFGLFFRFRIASYYLILQCQTHKEASMLLYDVQTHTHTHTKEKKKNSWNESKSESKNIYFLSV